jgi:hypothetical protein
LLTARGTIAEEEFADNISEVVNSLEGGKDCSCYVGGYEGAGIPSKPWVSASAPTYSPTIWSLLLTPHAMVEEAPGKLIAVKVDP